MARLGINFITSLMLLHLVKPGQSEFVRWVDEEAMVSCHTGQRVNLRRQCDAYRQGTPEQLAASDEYPAMAEGCMEIEWLDANQENNWGNCMEMTTDSEYRYITSNNVPDYYMNPYCPIGLGYGYCVPQEQHCFFPDLICGVEGNGPGTTQYGDVWVPEEHHFKIPLEGNPTRSDRPGDMYVADQVGAAKDLGAAIGIAINGINIQGPNDAGDVSIDEGGFQLACGGHVTPPTTNLVLPTLPPDPNDTMPHPTEGSPPLYHYHKSPECLPPFKNASVGLAAGGRPDLHGQLMGWALDGFGIYSYQDIGGSAPVVDECGGHFGPVDSGEVLYHYHSRPIVPYHLACQGPSLGQCSSTQQGTNYCHQGCGHDVCVQPGTPEQELRSYLARWDDGWLDKHDTNQFN